MYTKNDSNSEHPNRYQIAIKHAGIYLQQVIRIPSSNIKHRQFEILIELDLKGGHLSVDFLLIPCVPIFPPKIESPQNIWKTNRVGSY